MTKQHGRLKSDNDDRPEQGGKTCGSWLHSLSSLDAKANLFVPLSLDLERRRLTGEGGEAWLGKPV